MAKKKKLSKEELRIENEKIREDMHTQNQGSSEDSERIVNSLKGFNIASYALLLVLPIIGIWWLWYKKDKLKLNQPSMIIWTGIGVVILVEQIMLIYQNFAG